jgi:hypothetical protein
MTNRVLGDSTLKSLITRVNALAHFRALYPIAIAHTTCVFSLLTNDMHIVDPASDVLHFFYDYKKNLEH